MTPRSSSLCCVGVVALAWAGCSPAPEPKPALEPPPTATGAPSAEPATTTTATAAASTSAADAPRTEGCTFTPAPGKQASVDQAISILGLPGGNRSIALPAICPKQACRAGLTINLPKAGDWQPGIYDVDVATDNGSLLCRASVKKPSKWTRPAKCAHEKELSIDCAGPQPLSIGPIMIGGTPARVQVKIALDGKLLADQTLQPTFTNKRQDGFDCAPECKWAEASIKVP